MVERSFEGRRPYATDFVRSRGIESPEVVTLSPRDWEALREALINPPVPHEKLTDAAHRYRDRFGGCARAGGR